MPFPVPQKPKTTFRCWLGWQPIASTAQNLQQWTATPPHGSLFNPLTSVWLAHRHSGNAKTVKKSVETLWWRHIPRQWHGRVNEGHEALVQLQDSCASSRFRQHTLILDGMTIDAVMNLVVIAKVERKRATARGKGGFWKSCFFSLRVMQQLILTAFLNCLTQMQCCNARNFDTLEKAIMLYLMNMLALK